MLHDTTIQGSSEYFACRTSQWNAERRACSPGHAEIGRNNKGIKTLQNWKYTKLFPTKSPHIPKPDEFRELIELLSQYKPSNSRSITK